MLTERQKSIFTFILEYRKRNGCSPSIPEIQKEFAIRSPNGVVGHLLALQSKGLIRRGNRGSRQIDVVDRAEPLRTEIHHLPLYDSVSAGMPQVATSTKPSGCISLDESTLGFVPGEGCFAIEVRGDSMRDAAILDGDLVVVEPCDRPRENQIVVAVIDGERTLKRLGEGEGEWFLKAENPSYPNLYPRQNLEIQGVVRAVVRRVN